MQCFISVKIQDSHQNFRKSIFCKFLYVQLVIESWLQIYNNHFDIYCENFCHDNTRKCVSVAQRDIDISFLPSWSHPQPQITDLERPLTFLMIMILLSQRTEFPFVGKILRLQAVD